MCHLAGGIWTRKGRGGTAAAMKVHVGDGHGLD